MSFAHPDSAPDNPDLSPPEVRVPELLAPAGNWECARAAVANGADAVYFGLDCGFNARARAANFALDELSPLVEFLHRHRVAGYVTLNTLAFSDELESIVEVVHEVDRAGVDAVLVQDLGVARLIRSVAPDLPIHASTQMTLTSAECIEEARALGIERVVLARELSIAEIAAIHRASDMQLEVFVHGALCVAYSGQCLTSESLGGRSANRGQCAQACRLPYELVCDGQDVDLGDQQYLLSPQDLAAYALVPELIQAGAMSLKIEGRLKTPEYVANITRHYRQAIDQAVAGRPVEFTAREIEDMELSFSRGFSPGWLQGCDHKMLVPALTSAKQGVRIGRVEQVRQGAVRVRLSGSVKPGDGIVFQGDRAREQEEGGRIFSLHQQGRRRSEEISAGMVEMRFGNDAIRWDRLWRGQTVWKTDDPALTKRLRRTFRGDLQGRDLAIGVHVNAAVDQPLKIRVAAPGLPEFELESADPLEPARKHPLTQEVLQTQLGRLGGTGYFLEDLQATLVGNPMAPLSVLGKLRHAMTDRLRELERTHPKTRRPAPLDPAHLEQSRKQLAELRQGVSSQQPKRLGEPAGESDSRPTTVRQLHVLCRTLGQLESLGDRGVKRVYVDFQDIRQYGEAVATAHGQGQEIYLATPRIQKPGEMGLFRSMSKHPADGFLVRNLSGLRYFHDEHRACVADFSFNTANELTFHWLRELGAEVVTSSYDLNRDQLIGLTRAVDASRLEVVIHQHMPMFHMEHCVFCAVLSPGTNKTNCGRPCDDHVVHMRDRTGVEHLLVADVGCRNTLFNATAQSGAEAVEDLIELGVSQFRVELLEETAQPQVRKVVSLYQQLLAGTVTGQDVWHSLKAMNRVGVTRGTLEHQRDPLAII